MIWFGALGAAGITPRALVVPCWDEPRAAIRCVAMRDRAAIPSHERGTSPARNRRQWKRGRKWAHPTYTWEQRASGAFAAEFLAPLAGLDKRLDGHASPAQIDELAEQYGVSALTIGHQIENHRLAWITD